MSNIMPLIDVLGIILFLIRWKVLPAISLHKDKIKQAIHEQAQQMNITAGRL
jgi:hypothetical protein